MLADMKTPRNQEDNPFSLLSNSAYLTWRENKLSNHQTLRDEPVITLNNLSSPSESERVELVRRCKKTNYAIYSAPQDSDDSDQIRGQLRSFADALGLRIAEKHRSAGEQGIVALTVTDNPAQRGYIPYTRRPINWHTDGYYNAPDDQILAMVLHCVRQADDGGVNQVLDPDIAYIRLRDLNPDYIAALMQSDAMSIPENHEPDGTIRPVSTGPVFWFNGNGKLIMRYTARTRSIHWKDDGFTPKAAAALQDILESNDPLMQTIRMEPGQGLLCNNVLHNRTGFDSDLTKPSERIMFRVRFHNRVKDS